MFETLAQIYKRTQFRSFFVLCLGVWAPSITLADVVKPALAELTLYPDRHYTLEIRASIEAMLTDINTDYKNTQDAPNSAQYDVYRAMSSTDLLGVFTSFTNDFLGAVSLQFDQKTAALSVDRVEIPEPGYQQVPRISIIYLRGQIPLGSEIFEWLYPQRFGDNAFRYRFYKEDDYTWSDWRLLNGGESSGTTSLHGQLQKMPLVEVITSYIKLGYLHILPRGLDHILFVVGIFLLSTRWRPLLWQVSAFTVAHTITLGLSISGYIDLPARIVEPLIALSIAWVGVENLLRRDLHYSRVTVVFVFGLLHGLGFAGVLRDFGMPQDDFLTALISFNIGVEFGQLTILALGYLILAKPWGKHRYYRPAIVIPGSLAITCAGLVWTVQRLA